ncbi:hypothetical protein Tco_1336174 [Tanacetum coccineum]
MQKESVSKQGRKPAKSEPTVHKDPTFDDLDDVDVNDAMDYMETMLTCKRDVSTEDQFSTAEPKDGNSNESAAPTTVFRDDETIAEFLVSMSQTKAKQKDKGKKVTEEEAEFVVQEDWEVEEEMKKLDEEEATKAALIQDFDDIQARIEADRLLAARLQEEERETFTVEERAKFLYDTIATQRRFLAQQRANAIRSRPPTRTQLRNQMMTYLKHVKRSDKDFIAIGSAEDERQIKEMNEESKDPKKKRVINETPREEDTTKKRDIFRWRLYEACGVCILELKDGTSIYMLVERRYPLSKELLQRMLDLGLEVERGIKSWLVQDQTVPVQKQTDFGKDKSNPLIVDSLLKTIRLLIHLVVYNEELAIPEQTATGKGISNPLMASSLPKTTKPT